MDHDTAAGRSLPRPPLVPGLVVGGLLGRGAHGEVWAARDPATGERVAVKVGRRADDAQGRAAREVALLARLDHPHVVRLRNVVECPDGTRALVLALAEGGSLARLVAARGRLTPGETVTVVVALARTLADLHGIGLVHGDLAPGNVLLDADGRPLVADLGVASVLGRGDGNDWGTPGYADPAASCGPVLPGRDVFALGALVRFCLLGRPDGAEPAPLPSGAGPAGAGSGGAVPVAARLLALADLCTDPDPARRPDAAEVARVAWAAGPARPVRLVDGTGTSTADGRADGSWDGAEAQAGAAASGLPDDVALLLGAAPPGAGDVTRRVRAQARTAERDRAAAQRAAQEAARERRRARTGRALRWLALVTGAVVVGAAVAWAALWRLAGPATPDEAALHAVVTRLAEGRAAAFRSASVAPLADVDEAGSTALAADAALVERLAAAKVRLDGLRFEVASVRLDRADGPAVTVTARVTTSAHRRVGADGRVVGRVPRDAPQDVRLVLVRDGEHWRVRSVGPASVGTAPVPSPDPSPGAASGAASDAAVGAGG